MELEEGAAFFLHVNVCRVDLPQELFDCVLRRTNFCKRRRENNIDVLYSPDDWVELGVIDACQGL